MGAPGELAGPRVSELTLLAWLPCHLPSVEPSARRSLSGGVHRGQWGSTKIQGVHRDPGDPQRLGVHRYKGGQIVAPPSPTMPFPCPGTGQDCEILNFKTLKSYFLHLGNTLKGSRGSNAENKPRALCPGLWLAPPTAALPLCTPKRGQEPSRGGWGSQRICKGAFTPGTAHTLAQPAHGAPTLIYRRLRILGKRGGGKTSHSCPGPAHAGEASGSEGPLVPG